jgi:hypothetical protein
VQSGNNVNMFIVRKNLIFNGLSAMTTTDELLLKMLNKSSYSYGEIVFACQSWDLIVGRFLNLLNMFYARSKCIFFMPHLVPSVCPVYNGWLLKKKTLKFDNYYNFYFYFYKSSGNIFF